MHNRTFWITLVVSFLNWWLVSRSWMFGEAHLSDVSEAHMNKIKHDIHHQSKRCIEINITLLKMAVVYMPHYSFDTKVNCLWFLFRTFQCDITLKYLIIAGCFWVCFFQQCSVFVKKIEYVYDGTWLMEVCLHIFFYPKLCISAV